MVSLWRLWRIVLSAIGIAPSSDSAVDVSLDHSWPWPTWVTLLLWMGCAAIVLRTYMSDPARLARPQRILLVVLRVSVITLVLFMMHGWVVHRHRVDLPDLIVALDDSLSMATEDHYSAHDVGLAASTLTRRAGLPAASRWNQSLSLLHHDGGAWLQALEARYRIKAYRIGESARVMAEPLQDGIDVSTMSPPAELGSQLGDGLKTILDAQRGRPTAALILLTDGITTSGSSLPDVAELARQQGVPLFLVGLGDDLPPRDIRLTDLLVDAATFVGDVLSFDAKIQHDGFPGAPVTVQLLDEANEVLDEQRVTLNGFGGAQPVRLSHRPQRVGEREYQIRLPVQAGESSAENNQLTQRVLVRDEQIRVLLVEGLPSYEFRTLRQLLSRLVREETGDRVVQLTTLLQSADFEIADQDETAIRVFPVRREELFAYDVLVFGDVDPAQLTSSMMEQIAEFVTVRGGGVIFIAGNRFNPTAYAGTALEHLFPVDLADVSHPPATEILDQPYAVATTPLGRASPHLQLGDSPTESDKIWRRLPPLYWFLSSTDLKPSARLLVEQLREDTTARDALPVIMMMFVGAGKVVFHATDETYRWAQYQGDDRYYSRYWLQLIRYLSRSKLLSGGELAELSTDRDLYQQGDAARIQLRLGAATEASPPIGSARVVFESDRTVRRELVLHSESTESGLWGGFVDDLNPGRYRVWLVDPQLERQPAAKHFEVQPRSGEHVRLEMQVDELRQAASISHGRFYRIHQARRLPDDLPVGRRVQIEELTPDPLWNSNWLAAAFVVLITTEWLLRRKLGMI